MKDATKMIIDQLTGGSKQLKILSIVGMLGLGKTTLADSVYKHPSVNIHFHVRAWCCVSQVYQKQTLLSELLDQIVEKTYQGHQIEEEYFSQNLYQSLKGRKYLIVIDDIWDIEAWDALKRIFPDDQSGSRILFTTRHRDVASEANSISYPLRLLSDEECCKLLWLELFDRETCPPDLLIISKHIAGYCKGLPLAVVLIAGILKKTEKNRDSWEQVVRTLIRSHGTRNIHFAKLKINKLLDLSYMHLPNFLKPCFLYFGTFSEDTTISASKLRELWICQGFVQPPDLGH
ncbi:hypothetical protein ACH5RR_034460 [Cinchona calisaya]|uniref:NB-ARC domain-containing protein n=1 Tax=Cinchona calisaya TaxID=153742 RepID=A0ABD2YEI2_9GENT